MHIGVLRASYDVTLLWRANVIRSLWQWTVSRRNGYSTVW